MGARKETEERILGSYFGEGHMKEGFSEEEKLKLQECKGADPDKTRGGRGGELSSLRAT